MKKGKKWNLEMKGDGLVARYQEESGMLLFGCLDMLSTIELVDEIQSRLGLLKGYEYSVIREVLERCPECEGYVFRGIEVYGGIHCEGVVGVLYELFGMRVAHWMKEEA